MRTKVFLSFLIMLLLMMFYAVYSVIGAGSEKTISCNDIRRWEYEDCIQSGQFDEETCEIIANRIKAQCKRNPKLFLD